MDSDEIEAASKSGTNIRNDKNAVIDYDEDRVRLESIEIRGLNVYESGVRVIIVACFKQ